MADCSGEGGGFTINKEYAKKYNTWRQKEEIQKLKDRYGSDIETDSDSEIEDENAEALTSQVEKDWLRTFAAVKSKDPCIYQKDKKFYHSEANDSSEDETSKKKKKKNKTEKPMFIKDYERKLILEKKGIAIDENDSKFDRQKLSYFEEQDKIKESFKPALDSSDSSDGETELFTKKEASKEQEEKDEDDYLEWLKGHRDTLDKNTEEELEPLKNYWNNPKLDEGEKFLKDFILNKRYISKDVDDTEFDDFDEGAGFSEEEEELEKEKNFERKYNFRFEEPDAEFIKSYPRTVKDSVRTKDNTRSLKRIEIKLRKQEKKNRKSEEIKQLKNLKKQEIYDKVESLKQITGNTHIGFTEHDLEGDFNPETYDKMMQKHFGSEYYGADEGDIKKPSFPSDDELDFDTEDWDHWDGGGEDNEGEEHAEDTEGPFVDDADFVMDADYNPNQDLRPGKKRKHSKFYQALVKKKPVFDPNDKTFEEYFDEYYKLDYEDIIGDLPCRFKYRKAVSNDFGLSVGEILKCPDRELNAWVSVKKMSQYRTEDEELRDIKTYQKKAQNITKKINILPSLREKSEPKPGTSADGEEIINNRLKKLKKDKKNKNSTNLSENCEDDILFKVKNKTKLTEATTDELRVKKKRKDDTDVKTNQQESTNILFKQKQINANQNSHEVKKRKRSVNNSETNKESVDGESSPKEKRLKTETMEKVETASDLTEKSNTSVNKKRKKKKKKKKPKPFEISDVRLKAYGINPKKFKYTKSKFLTV